MSEKIKIEDVYDKNINFLIGSGASFGMLPTLALGIKDEDEQCHTIETLSTLLEKENKDDLKTLLFMHYYNECIKPAMELDGDNIGVKQQKVIDSYEELLLTILQTMSRNHPSDRRCNIFTTNYDGCIEFTAEELLSSDKINFILNDGARGFRKRYLHVRNFNSFSYQTGIFDQHKIDIPQINLIHLHGSVYWGKYGDEIIVDYVNKNKDKLLDEKLFIDLGEFSKIVNDNTSKSADIYHLTIDEGIKKEFWKGYNQLPIVNPTKWKFYETVFEEHYYQMLRYLSYELEKPNTVLITFGFSFADEHILHLVQRSLSNPSVQLYVCCFNETEYILMGERFKEYNNVELVTVKDVLDFDKFNNEVFTLSPPIKEEE